MCPGHAETQYEPEDREHDPGDLGTAVQRQPPLGDHEPDDRAEHPHQDKDPDLAQCPHGRVHEEDPHAEQDQSRDDLDGRHGREIFGHPVIVGVSRRVERQENETDGKDHAPCQVAEFELVHALSGLDFAESGGILPPENAGGADTGYPYRAAL